MDCKVTFLKMRNGFSAEKKIVGRSLHCNLNSTYIRLNTLEYFRIGVKSARSISPAQVSIALVIYTKCETSMI